MIDQTATVTRVPERRSEGQPAPSSAPTRADRLGAWLADHLLGILVALLLLATLLPFAAPLLMHWGWVRPAQALY